MDSNKLRVSTPELTDVAAGLRAFDEDAMPGARDGSVPQSEISTKFARELREPRARTSSASLSKKRSKEAIIEAKRRGETVPVVAPPGAN